MRHTITTLLGGLLIFVFVPLASAQMSDQREQEPWDVHFFGRLQTLGFMQAVKDEFRDNARLYLYLKQARLGVHATYEDVAFDLQLAFGGEEEVRAPSPGVALSLLDLSADIPIRKSLRVRVGQYKVPYGRENIVDEGAMLFSEPSIQYLGSKLGRDVGITLHGYSGSFASALGIFTGGGRDVPIRYIPLDLGFPMVVARVGLNEGIDDDIFTTHQTGFESGSGMAMYVNALYMKDSKVGHSTAFNVKLADKSLFLNSNWNPFIAKRPLEKNEFWQAGFDMAMRMRMPNGSVISGEAEYNYGIFKNPYGKITLSEGRALASYYTKPIELAVRYAFLRPDAGLGVTDGTGKVTQIVDEKLIQEIGFAISYYLKGDWVKLTAELPVYIDVPVATEPNLGAYVLTQQVDQTSVLVAPTNGKVSRQTVVEARMQLQVRF